MNSARPRILLFEPYLFDQMYGNMRYLASIVRWHDRSRFDLEIVTPRQSAFAETLRSLGAEVRVAPAPEKLLEHGGSLMGGLLQQVRAALSIVAYSRRLFQVIRDGRYDVVHCHSIRAVLTIGWAARLSGRPVLWYVKGILANPLLDRIGFLLASRILFQGPTNRDRRYRRLVRLFRRKVGVLANGIELEDVREAPSKDPSELRRALGLDPKRLNLVAVGQVSPNKGLQFVFEALAMLKGTTRPISLYIVGGDGIDAYRDHRAFLENLAQKKGLTDIHFLGWRQDVYQIVSQMDAMVHASLEEGVPKSVIEAMALRRAVVVTRVGSVPDVVQNDVNGIMVEPRDARQLAEAIGRIAADNGLRQRLADAGYEFAWKSCSIQTNVRGLEAVWSEIITR
jgi:glycosyltransferase involved in cell wall biosynthesis